MFVRTRMGAYAVASLLQKLPAVSWMRSAMLVGGGSDVKALDMTPEVRQQWQLPCDGSEALRLLATTWGVRLLATTWGVHVDIILIESVPMFDRAGATPHACALSQR